MFLYNTLKNAGDIPVSVLYYSFEMSADTLYAKILSLYIWDTFQKEISYETTKDMIIKKNGLTIDLSKPFGIKAKSAKPLPAGISRTIL